MYYWNMAKVAVHILFEEDVVKQIDRQCGGPKKNGGVISGRSQWIRHLVCEKLGIQETESGHSKKHMQAYKDLILCETPCGMSYEERVVLNLLKTGYGLNSIANYLNAHGFVTKRGKEWQRATVHQVLLQIRLLLKASNP